MTETVIRTADAGDAPALARIYNHYIRETIVTFEETEVSPDEMGARLATVANGGLPWLVARAGRTGVRIRLRESLAATQRLSVLRRNDGVPRSGADARGIGSRLYADLLARLEAMGLHAALGGIALPNAASVALHEKFGFRKVAHLSEVGLKFGGWIDVGYWQRLLSGVERGAAMMIASCVPAPRPSRRDELP